MRLEDVQNEVKNVLTAFEAFKTENNAILGALKKGISVDPLMFEKLGRINADLDKHEDLKNRVEKQEAAQKAADKALEALEVKINRGGGGGNTDDPAKAKQEAKAAFEKWCRKGKENLSDAELKVLRVSDDTSGGYLAPPEYVAEMIKAEIEFSPMRPLVRVRSTSQRSIQVPKRTGTFTASWVAETGTRNENTGLAYGLEEIPTHELTAEVYISMQELEDSAFNMEAELNAEFSEQFGVAEGLAIVTGDKNGKPEGFLSNANVQATNSGLATTISADGILRLFYGIKTAYSKNASYVLNRATLASVRTLKGSDGQYLWAPMAVNQAAMINGAPYTEVPDMPNEGAGAKPVAFGDWKRAYTLVDRLVFAMLRDPYTRAANGQIKFVARRRLGGQVTLAEAIRTLTCAV